jgi:hypothetical protein
VFESGAHLSQTVTGRQAVTEPSHRTPERYDQAATHTWILYQAPTCAFSLIFSVAQRDAVHRHSPMPAGEPVRRDRLEGAAGAPVE